MHRVYVIYWCLQLFEYNFSYLFQACRRRRSSSHSSIEMTDLKKDVRILKRTRKVPSPKLPPSLEIRRELILQSIKLDYTRIIFIWSCFSEFPIEFAVQTFSRYGVVTNVHYRRFVSVSNGLNMRCGALVEFPSRFDAEKAYKKCPRSNK